MNQCPECGARRFVSKLLVYEITGYDEGGEQEFRRQHVRAEFEYTGSGESLDSVVFDRQN
ncbi:hypothetical protein [Halobellus clavatus]|uniref:Uncharacterized protein n=1 Tax=Halobellus clavatus TaxID=660517 RepID=A0A1H3KNA5_9EURY|nr:hypothetical protein [Halobellus clavatus]SDY53074.1 hypothetical protein SAMN04487946_12042 [Halobellus clavatus]